MSLPEKLAGIFYKCTEQSVQYFAWEKSWYYVNGDEKFKIGKAEIIALARQVFESVSAGDKLVLGPYKNTSAATLCSHNTARGVIEYIELMTNRIYEILDSLIDSPTIH